MTDQTTKQVARGAQPQWEATFPHKEYGELTFKATLPTAMQLADHYVAIDNLLAELHGTARGATMLLTAAIAGLQVLIELPVVDQREVEDPDDPDHVKIERLYYDSTTETDLDFLVEVWMSFSNWRKDIFDNKDELKNSSGEASTPGSDSSGSSSSDLASPSTTPA